MSILDLKLKNDEIDLFFNAILELKDIEECYKFFEDVATINEIKSLAQRIHVAQLLKDKNTYTEIIEKTGASTATISRVNRAYNYGTEGYKVVLDRLEEKRKKNK
ncbi:MAG: YerC/YecD family TrpR-related protein [Clostridium sp.]